MQFQIMTLLSSVDICRLGATSRYWRALVRDPLLWKFFLLRDMPSWTSIDHLTMPQLEAPEGPVISDDAEQDDYERTESKVDYMAEWVTLQSADTFIQREFIDSCVPCRYLKACPSCRQRWLPSWPPYRVLTSFLQSLVPSAEPRYVMFGPGMEQLDVSLVTRLMHASDILPMTVVPSSQINGTHAHQTYFFKYLQSLTSVHFSEYDARPYSVLCPPKGGSLGFFSMSSHFSSTKTNHLLILQDLQ